MATMRAAVLVEPRRFALLEVPVPEIGPEDALIRVTRTGVCGTDIHIFNGHYAADRLPMVPGHEFCGVIARLGSNVRHLALGQSCVADINIGCGACFWCRRNEVLNCPEVTQVGIGRDGAFAEYVALPARLVIPTPAAMPHEVQALVEPVACVARAARKAGARFGRSTVVLGCGPIGNLHVQMLRLCGLAPIIAADLSPERLALAREAGADAVAAEPQALRALVREMTGGRGADLVVESVGSARLYGLAFELIRKGGHVAFFGLTGPGETVPVEILRTVLEENGLKGSVAGMGEDMHDALALLAHGRFRTEAFTRASYPLERIQEAFESLAARPGDLKTQIVLN
jgi:threonine dehydrogenase-like Zn-dependent dehydrogenase